MNTMTPPTPTPWPVPTTTPPAPAAPKKSHKGLIILAALIGLGIIGAIGNASDQAKNNATIKQGVSDALVNNTGGGGVDEAGYVRDTCANSLDMDWAGASETFRQGLAAGEVTMAGLAESFAKGYYDKDGGVGTYLTRPQVVAACTDGLRNG